MFKTTFAGAAIALALATPALSNGTDDKTIVDIAAEDGRFTTLVAAVSAAGLADTLSGGRPVHRVRTN